MSNMTEIITAFEEGKRVQKRITYRASDGDRGAGWVDLAEPVFDFNTFEYRIYTEPAWMKIGSELLASLRRDYKWLEDHHKDVLITNKVTIMELINTISRLKGELNNAHLLLDQYKEKIKEYKNGNN